MSAELLSIPLAQLRESPLNPRTHFDPTALQELAASLKASGQIEAILVRRAKDNGHYEIAAGHRRFRAAQLAGLPALEARVRDLDDKTFLEILTVSNLQRDDLHPLEEAQGYRLLMERAGYDVAKIAARVGRSVKYVYDRVKLLQLTKPAQTLFLDGKMTAGHAILLARLSPTDQKRAIGDPEAAYTPDLGGLFRSEEVDDELPLKDAQAARSVREFEQWINENVRFTETTVDPFLFPETAHAVTVAAEDEEKVVHITHDYRVSDGARDEHQRTYGAQAWKRADGKQKSKGCEHSALGVVVAGPGRGGAFRVCIAKQKCAVHWPEQFKAAARAKKRPASGTATVVKEDPNAGQARFRAEEAQRDAERARWNKAVPALAAALAEKVKALPITRAIDVLCEYRSSGKVAAQYLPVGRTAESALRHLAFDLLHEDILTTWNLAASAPKELKAFGIDARKIVDQVAPRPALEKKQTAKPPAKKTKK